MNFHAKAPKIPPRILCIGMPVRDLTFRILELPERGLKVNASHFDEIAGGNALNAAIGIVRLQYWAEVTTIYRIREELPARRRIGPPHAPRAGRHRERARNPYEYTST